jgi:hypothetical protein
VRSEDQIRADAADRRPFSNQSEYDIWADRHCYDCVNDNPQADPEVFCPILNVAMLGPAAWPAEWLRRHIKFGARIEGTSRVEVIETDATDPDGFEIVGDCTEFERRPDPGDEPEPEPEPPPVCEGQLDIIDAYLPVALAELGRAPARAEQ